MTNLVDDRDYKLYRNVAIKQIRFQEGTDSYLTIYFGYADDEKWSIEIYVKGGVKNNKDAFLIEVDSLLNSIDKEYISVKEISERINKIEISDWALSFIK